MHPSQIAAADYSYSLPEEKIAFHPAAQRDGSRLLIYKNGRITDSYFSQVAEQIPAGTLLVFNDTKVIEARLLFEKSTGSTIELFCLAPAEKYPDITTGLAQCGQVQWQCLVGGASKWKPGSILEKKIKHDAEEITIRAAMHSKGSGYFVIDFSWQPALLSFAEILHLAGAMPLPPYIRRKAADIDSERYQTIFARQEGSVAAPTASLHFTPGILSSFTEKKIATAFLTLHVGAGTFKPVKSETMAGHDMHSEYFDVPVSAIEQLIKQEGNPIIAVGTTALRTIESLYWAGVKLIKEDGGKNVPQMLHTGQWEPYEQNTDIPATDALQALLQWMKERKMRRLTGQTQLLIAPGYRFRFADALITNFHQPQSTLLLLVAALTGPDWKKIYAHALQQDYRFLSYGDSSLLWRGER
ncbi:MAG TPA: S-adenosylmethionine:tRNA ribosyltransferase-isomerase [Chitinophagaceae bacterium]|nr:S-adenosylmethionine:tRNA ribosyltransferase-isomerase [Chitinophagaceae bacterium]